MRTRSSRFFVILLHLLGVSNHHLPSWYYDLTTSAGSDTTERARFYSGIRGVHPHSIVLERIDLQDVGGLDGVEWLDDDGIHIGDTVSSSSSSSEASTKSAQHQHRHLQQETATAVPREPFWLQDSRDGKCLGPNGGFSECGDATLWFILRQSTKRKSLRMGPFGVEEILEQRDPKHPYRYALQIVDNDYEMGSELQQSSQSQSQQPPLSFFSFWRQHRREQRQNDCLVPSSSFLSSSSVSLQQQKQTPSLELGPCAKQKKAWAWRVDEEGILYLPEDFTRDGRGRRCLRRTKASSAVLASCSNLSNSNSNTTSTSSADRLVQFSLVRYHATQTSNIPSSSQASLVRPVTPEVTSSRRSQQQQSSDTITNRRNSVEGELPPKSGKGLPKTRDIAHNHATRRVVHNQPLFEMNLVSRPLLTTVTRKESTAAPFSALKDSNPILFFGSSASSNDKQKENKKTSPSKPSPSSGTPGKLRRIEVHSYIAASKDEIWVDPQTGLEYHTDLCHYLGHDRKESGRHTLMGVGQFVKTMLKIKVYGIALYVSKRDVLADPSFQQYAGLSAEELRKLPDFYEKLRTQPAPTDDPTKGGFFDRTLFLKTNMQLSTETMRSSLESDWKLLSADAKNMLIDSSLRPRPANQQMLDEIVRDDNPSRCSCSQTAPEEYNADPSCCARGIELAFTWRKNGNLEVRLNGRLMDSFPRPDIAEGIFFEYLRLDDPFSVEFIEKTVDGFPFLLSPLAQIQGVTPPVMQQSKTSTDERPSFLKTIGGAAETFTSHATGLFGAMQHGATEAAASTVQAVQSAGYSFRNLGEEMDRKREFVWKQLTALPHQNPTQMFSDFVAKVKGEKTEEEILNETEPEIFDNVSSHAPHGRIFRPTTSQWFGETLEAPDEIAPIIHPTMNKTILSLVHLYLLLLLIVSFPGTNNNRTRFVVRRSCKSISVSSSDSSLLKYGADDMDECLLVNEPFIRKEKVASPFREYHDNSSNHNIKNADSGDSNGSQQQQQQNSSSGKQFFNGARVTMKRSI